MTNRLKALFNRIEHWPKSAQDEAVHSLLAIEEEYLGGGDLSPEDRVALERSAEDVRLGRIADEAEALAVFERYRNA